MQTTYRVGTTRFDVTDETREEKLGPKTGKRMVTVRLYYPAIVKDEEKVEIPKKTVGEMYKDAQMVTGEKFPLIVYSHGYGAYLESNNHLCCKLAEQGYVVAAVGHLYESDKLTLADGTEIPTDKEATGKVVQPRFRGTMASFGLLKTDGTAEERYERFNAFQQTYSLFLHERLPEWAADAEAVIENLKKDYADNIDFTKVGLTGHSFGGNAAYYMCQHFPEKYTCGANIDGGIFGNFEGMRMQKPFLQICNHGNEGVVSRALLETDAPVRYEVFDKVTHIGFTDMAHYTKARIVKGALPWEEMDERLVRVHVEFFGEWLKS